ncbi:UDP-glycosyltransferase 83A1, partial [Cucurbita argyrosperma subsp. argyrosperma]
MAEKKGGRVVVIPFPAQGHVNPLMHISKGLAKEGIKITMINTDFIHSKLLEAMGQNIDQILGPNVELLGLPDGFPLHENRDDIHKLFVDIMNNLKPQFEKLLAKMNTDHDGGLACAIVDMSMGWVLEIAASLGVKGAIFTPFTAAHSVLNLSLNELIESGIITPEGTPVEEKTIELESLGTPSMIHTSDLPWRCVPLKNSQKILFDHLVRVQRGCHYAKWYILILPHVLEPQVVSLNPKLLTIGPLIATEAGQLWKEDDSCIRWLDQQPAGSVVYMAFGSSTDFNQEQFEEIAMGMELTERPFMWVVRQGTEHQLPAGFKGGKGKIVSWVSQQKVLNHPSVGIFMSHCGWNSVIEGVSSGLPFLCWPYVGDHFLNMKYVTEIWKVGIGFEREVNGVVSRWEIKKKVELVGGDEEMKDRSRVLAEEIRRCWEGADAPSALNFDRLVKWAKQEDDDVAV